MIPSPALGGMIPLINMQLGEIIVGGVGPPACTAMLLFVIISIFVAGLMVGRTPEYVGKKIEAKEVKMAMPRHPDPAADVSRLDRGRGGDPLGGRLDGQSRGRTASPRSSTRTPRRPPTTARPSPASPENTMFYNLTGAAAMLVGRFWMIIPAMAIAGSLAQKEVGSARRPETFSRRPAASSVGLVVGVIVIIGGPDVLPGASPPRTHRRAARNGPQAPCFAAN